MAVRKGIIMMRNIKTALLCLSLLCAACGTQKNAVQSNNNVTEVKPNTTKRYNNSSFSLVQKVNDTQVAAQNIVADMTFEATMGSKDVSVPGSLHMRKDQIIRLQLFVPIIHTEVGRLEFTPDYVLVVDRIHKQYVKEDYNKLDFLRDNKLNFYSLQALFWNQIFLPGSNSISQTDLQDFKGTFDGSVIKISLSEGNMSYVWNANSQGLISDALVTYSSAAHGNSSLTWKYSDFKAVGAKMFPAYEEFTFNTTSTKKAQNINVILDMDDISTSAKWDTNTNLSSKYKKIEATDIFGKLFNNM